MAVLGATCGPDGIGPHHPPGGLMAHPCHYAGYTCRKPATLRLYDPRMVALAGVQVKVEVSSTYACDEHWPMFEAGLRALRR